MKQRTLASTIQTTLTTGAAFFLFLTTTSASSAEINSALEFVEGTAPPEAARVILIGETHNVPYDLILFDEVLQTFKSNNSASSSSSIIDTVLLEGYDRTDLNRSYPSFLLKDHPIAGPFRLIGWDDETALNETIENLREALLHQDLIDSASAPAARKISAFFKIQVLHFERDQLFLKRNTRMIETISMVLNQSPGKVFVRAGSAHFLKDARIAKHLRRHGVPYSVLIPKTGHPMRIPTGTDTEYTRSLVQKKTG